MKRYFTLLTTCLGMMLCFAHTTKAQSTSQATINVDQGILAFPPLPKMTISKDGGIMISNTIKTQSRSAANLKGVWVAAKLMMDAQGYSVQNTTTYWGQGACPGQVREKVSHNGWDDFWCEVFGTCDYRWRTPIHAYANSALNSTFYLAPKRVDTQQNTKDNTFFVWVPLKNTNNLYYTVTSQYEIAKTYQLNYGDSFTQSSIVKTGYTSSNTAVKSMSHDQTSKTEYDFGQELSTRIEASAGIKLEGLIDLSTKTTIGTKQTAAQKFGFSYKDEYATSFQESYESTKETTTSFTIERYGPSAPGFVKAYVDLYPTSDYTFTGNDDGSPIDIAPYIDYDGKQFTSIANFIEYVFEPNQFYQMTAGATDAKCSSSDLGSLGYQPKQEIGNLYKYLHQYPNVMTMNDGISTDFYNQLAATFGNSYLPTKTHVWTYSIEQPSVHLNYDAQTYSIEQPTDCSPLTKAPTAQNNADRSIVFFWDAPVSATKFKLEIKRKSDSWDKGTIYTYSIDRQYDGGTKNPLQPTFTDSKTPYDISTVYVARVSSECGLNGTWLDPSPEIEFLSTVPDCWIDKTNIKAIKDIDSEYNITWNPVLGSQGYYIEYAIGDEDFSEARKRLSVTGFGAVHPFDIMQISTSYPLHSDTYFKVKITPQCSGSKGTATVQYFSADGTIRTGPVLTGNTSSGLIIFPNPVPQGGTPQFLINNLKKESNLPEVTIYNVSKGTQVYSDLRPTIQVNEKVSITKALESGSYVLQIILPDTQEKLLGRFLVE